MVADVSIGMRYIYLEDCQVCCKPNLLHCTAQILPAEYWRYRTTDVRPVALEFGNKVRFRLVKGPGFVV